MNTLKFNGIVLTAAMAFVSTALSAQTILKDVSGSSVLSNLEESSNIFQFKSGSGTMGTKDNGFGGAYSLDVVAGHSGYGANLKLRAGGARQDFSTGGSVYLNAGNADLDGAADGVGGNIFFTAGLGDNGDGSIYHKSTAIFDETALFKDNARFDKDVTIVKNLTIGANSLSKPAGYSLYVKEGILTEKIKVALTNTTDWSDYVFEEGYKLLTLEEVSSYIKKNNHLPNIPSAQEVVDQGIDLAKMDASLLAKIEELTLYTIQLNERIKSLETQLQQVQDNK